MSTRPARTAFWKPAAIRGPAVLALVAVLLAVGGPVTAQTIQPTDISRPAGTRAFAADAATLLAKGTKSHDDRRLGPLGNSCNTCHRDADSHNPTFVAPWPHFVESVKAKSGLDRITAEGMVQFCMISAMGARPFAWDSETLAALTEFVLDRHRKVAAN